MKDNMNDTQATAMPEPIWPSMDPKKIDFAQILRSLTLAPINTTEDIDRLFGWVRNTFAEQAIGRGESLLQMLLQRTVDTLEHQQKACRSPKLASAGKNLCDQLIDFGFGHTNDAQRDLVKKALAAMPDQILGASVFSRKENTGRFGSRLHVLARRAPDLITGRVDSLLLVWRIVESNSSDWQETYTREMNALLVKQFEVDPIGASLALGLSCRGRMRAQITLDVPKTYERLIGTQLDLPSYAAGAAAYEMHLLGQSRIENELMGKTEVELVKQAMASHPEIVQLLLRLSLPNSLFWRLTGDRKFYQDMLSAYATPEQIGAAARDSFQLMQAALKINSETLGAILTHARPSEAKRLLDKSLAASAET